MVVNQINSYQEFKAIIAQDKLVVIDFMTRSSDPCIVMYPLFESFSSSYEPIDFFIIEVDVQNVSIQEAFSKVIIEY
jgi:thiol-disulfide isomerase/thioredoxin